MEEHLLEGAFEKDVYKIYRDAYAKCKYYAHIFHGMLQGISIGSGLQDRKSMLEDEKLQS